MEGRTEISKEQKALLDRQDSRLVSAFEAEKLEREAKKGQWLQACEILTYMYPLEKNIPSTVTPRRW